MSSKRDLLKKRYVQEYSRLIIVIIIAIVGGISILSYHYVHSQIKSRNLLEAARYQANTNHDYPCGYQQSCIGSSSQQTTASQSEVDCSTYSDPSDPTIVHTYASAVAEIPNSKNSTCALKCDLDKLILLEYQSKGLTISMQIYDQVYVKQIQKDRCGTPLPYCVFNPAVPCPVTRGSVSAEGGYDAGYSYAEQYQICDSNYDNGKSQDFNDGVHAWTTDNCS